jgi:NifB/MoaA-like Fe-S oxidoreductase
VPVGLTKHHPGRCRTYTRAESGALLDQVQPWREANRKRWGSAFLYPSDEWYLVAGRDVPPARDYDGFPQVENGIGMVRRLLDEWRALKTGLPARLPPATLACGTLIAPVLGGIVAELNELATAGWRLVPVANELFGAVTTASGLLAGKDVVAALGQQPQLLGELVLLPQAMFTGRYGAGSAPPGTTLDDMHISDIEASLGMPVRIAGTLSDALAACAEVAPDVSGRLG